MTCPNPSPNPNAYENLIIERKGPKAVLTFTREERLNALNAQTFRELIAAAEELEGDDVVQVVIVTGRGRGFVAGADITDYVDRTLLEYLDFQRLGRRMYDRWERLRQPVIAAVNGYALGGGFELVLVADLVVAAEEAKMGLPEAKLGLLPGGGGTQRLTRLVGRNKTKELLMTGDFITVTEARELGIVNRVVPAEKLMLAAHALADRILERAPPGGEDGQAARQRRSRRQLAQRHLPGDGDDRYALRYRRRARRDHRVH